MAAIVGFDFKLRADVPSCCSQQLKSFQMTRTAAAFTAVLLLSLSSTPATAQQIDRTSSAAAQAGDIQRFRLGDLRITTLSDGLFPQDLHNLMLGINPRVIDNILYRPLLTSARVLAGIMGV